jgi:hypothetical protein
MTEAIALIMLLPMILVIPTLAVLYFVTATVYLSMYLTVCYIKSLSNNLRIRVPFRAFACDPLFYCIISRVEIGRVEIGRVEVGQIEVS